MDRKQFVRRSRRLTVLFLFASVACWLFYVFNTDPKKEYICLFYSITMTSFTVIFFQSLFPKNKVLRIFTWIVAIPILPLAIVHIILSMRIFVAITLPFWSLLVISWISILIYTQLKLLHLGDNFDNYVIPYLILTSIATLYAYLDKYLVKLFARLLPENQMPQIVKDDGLKISEFQPFVKLTYFLMIVLTIWVTIERLSGQVYFNQFSQYKDIAFLSFGTFIVIDRFVGKAIRKT